MSKLVFQDKQTVYYVDTDAYSVLWHGASVKWFEKGRVELVKMYGIDAFELERQGLIMPVVELNIRYKSSAFLSDNLSIATEIHEVRPSAITFLHTVSICSYSSGLVTMTIFDICELREIFLTDREITLSAPIFANNLLKPILVELPAAAIIAEIFVFLLAIISPTLKYTYTFTVYHKTRQKKIEFLKI